MVHCVKCGYILPEDDAERCPRCGALQAHHITAEDARQEHRRLTREARTGKVRREEPAEEPVVEDAREEIPETAPSVMQDSEGPVIQDLRYEREPSWVDRIGGLLFPIGCLMISGLIVGVFVYMLYLGIDGATGGAVHDALDSTMRTFRDIWDWMTGFLHFYISL